MDRAQLIARKQEIQQQQAQTRRELARLTQQFGPQPDRGQRRTLARLEQQLESLMSQEYTLRLQIDGRT